MAVDFNAWLRQSDTTKIYLVETSAQRLADGLVVPLYFATQTITLQERCYLGCVSGLPRLTRQANDTLTANHIPTWGELELFLEMDYRPDPGRNYTWLELLSHVWNLRGQALTIKLGGEGFAYNDFQTIFAGRVDKYSWTDANLTLTLYDKTRELEQKVPDYELPVCPQVDSGSQNQPPPLVLGLVKNFKGLLLNTNNPGPYPLKYALACHVLEALDAVYIGNTNAPPSYYQFNQKDIFPPAKDAVGAAALASYGPYTGSLVRAEWLIEIDSITALNSQGASGPDVGLATFRWSLDGGASWPGSGILTWKLAPDTAAKSPAEGSGAMVLGGEYTGDIKRNYKIKITITGRPGAAKFRFSDDNGATWSAETDIADVNPILFSRGMTAAFTSTTGAPSAPAKTGAGDGTMTAAGPYDQDTILDYVVEIDSVAGGTEVGQATFRWSDDGGATWDGAGVTTDLAVDLNNGLNVSFFNGVSGGDPPNSFEVGDRWEFQGRPPYVADDVWSWTFKEIPVPLADGVAVQFTAGAALTPPVVGDDFVIGDAWRCILGSSLSLVSVTEGTNITVDARGLISPVTGAYVDNLGDIIQALLVQWRGWNAVADFDLTALAAFKAAFPYQVGLLVYAVTEISKIIDTLLTGIPALYTLTQTGKFFITEITPALAEPVLELTDQDFQDLPEGSDGDDNLYRRVYLHYDRNPNSETNPQGAPTPGRLQWLQQEWRQASRRDDSILTNYPWALDLGPLDTVLLLAADADVLALKLLNLHKVKHGLLTVICKLQPVVLDLWKTVRIRRSRFGDATGLVYAILGLELDYTKNEATLTLWR